MLVQCARSRVARQVSESSNVTATSVIRESFFFFPLSPSTTGKTIVGAGGEVQDKGVAPQKVEAI